MKKLQGIKIRKVRTPKPKDVDAEAKSTDKKKLKLLKRSKKIKKVTRGVKKDAGEVRVKRHYNINIFKKLEKLA